MSNTNAKLRLYYDISTSFALTFALFIITDVTLVKFFVGKTRTDEHFFIKKKQRFLFNFKQCI